MIKLVPLLISFCLFCRFLSLIAIDKKNSIHFVQRPFPLVIHGTSDIFSREGMLLLSISFSPGNYNRQKNIIHFAQKAFPLVISGASDTFSREGMLLLSISFSPAAEHCTRLTRRYFNVN